MTESSADTVGARHVVTETQFLKFSETRSLVNHPNQFGMLLS